MANRVESLSASEGRSNVLEAKARRSVRLPWALFIMYAILFIGLILAMLPFFWMLSASLMTYGETATRKLWPAVPQFSNYAEAWRQADFSKYFWNSVVITSITMLGQLTTSILAGYSFARIRFFGRDAIFALMLSTIMVPAVVTMIPNFQLISGRIAFIPLPGGSWLNTLQGITVPYMVSVFSIFLLRQFFAQVPWELWDAARIDGAGHLRFLGRIVLPISKAPILTVLIFGFIASWNDFLWPLLITTKDTWRPLMVGLWTLQSEAGPETQLIMAASVITIIPVLILYFMTQKEFTEGIATSGLKG
ncbi:MAG: carbohydrate ABC transporter permease [Caldilineaceae bacterium]|nr:carbohydrate ABC transporter permease [Caldilineaceae bacterium]